MAGATWLRPKPKLLPIIGGGIGEGILPLSLACSAIVTCCHSGLGGTGDVAILSASNRMSRMPFTQISTLIGGASTVILATILLGIFA